MSRRQGRHNAARRRGLTLVELMLGLIVTSVVGAAIASMLYAVTQATREDRVLRAMVARDKRALHAITAGLRSANQLLDATSTRVVCWYEDTNDDDTIDADELRALAYDATNDRLVWYEPNGSTPATTYTGAEDFGAVVDALIAAGQLDAETWASGVTAVSIATDDADPALADLISVRFTLREGVLDHESVAAVSLRNQ